MNKDQRFWNVVIQEEYSAYWGYEGGVCFSRVRADTEEQARKHVIDQRYSQSDDGAHDWNDPAYYTISEALDDDENGGDFVRLYRQARRRIRIRAWKSQLRRTLSRLCGKEVQ